MSESLPLRVRALMVFTASVVILLTAFGFQYIGGLQPCILCWWQRYPYVVTIVLALAAAALAARRKPAAALLALCGLVFLAGAGIAAFHVGVEQHWWQGTAECGANFGPAGSIEELRRRLEGQAMVRCDDIAWSLFGLSMAGYNFLLSLGLAAFALASARTAMTTTR
jgi:disulfide bond formation protein DsbB